MDTIAVSGFRIDAISACVPKRSIANEEKLAKSTGIVTRRIAEDGVDALELSLIAARKALADTGFAPDEFGAIISVSFTQEYRMPSSACMAQAKLGFSKDIAAFDITQACSGYVYGLYVAAMLARTTGRRVMLLDGDLQSAFMKAEDSATLPVLADAGSATIVSPDEGAASRFFFATEGDKGAALQLRRGGSIAMDGFGVFRFVATEVVGWLKRYLESAKASADDFDFFVPHQANVYMVRQLAKALSFSESQLLVSADRFGNPSSASIPLTIAACADRILEQTESRLLLAGFGGGLSVAIGSVSLPVNCKLSLLEA